jgi:hypothetical protein
VAIQSRARNAPKNISELPRSRITTSMSIASPHTSSSGPKCLSDGRSRITATSDATNTISTSDDAKPSPSTRIRRTTAAPGSPYQRSWRWKGSGRSRGRTSTAPASRR